MGRSDCPMRTLLRRTRVWVCGGWCQHMPQRDLDEAELTAGFLLAQTRLALQARAATRWAQDVPWERFLNDVLPYAVRRPYRCVWPCCHQHRKVARR